MNRTIKFRAWDSKNEKWIYFDLSDLAFSKKNKWAFIDIQNANEWTGLKDKNGKEIYEGDIVRIKGLGEGIMIFDERKVRFMWEDNAKERYGIENDDKFNEIIGNIYKD